MSIELKQGDALNVLCTMKSESVQCAITSPPYWGLRDYGVEGQLGLERTPEEYVCKLVEAFREVKRVLRDDGTLWLNLGDSYAGSGKGPTGHNGIGNQTKRQGFDSPRVVIPSGIKPKDLVGIPWMVAFALRADGWYLRSDIIWSKPNPMPESVTDRPTKAHEYVFLLSKSASYYYDSESIREPAIDWGERDRTNGKYHNEGTGLRPHSGLDGKPRKSEREGENGRNVQDTNSEAERRDGATSFNNNPRLRPYSPTRNRRTVWTIATSPYKGAHFATFPTKLVEPMVLAGAPSEGVVLDPFCGSGTVGAVCAMHSRSFIGIELNPAYIELARTRIVDAQSNTPCALHDAGHTPPQIAKQLKMSVPQVMQALAR